MKFNFKAAAVAAALALSGSAFAAINTSSDPDLLFIAYDANGNGGTYVRDLGSLSQIGTNNVTFSAPSSSIFSTQFAGVASSDIYWGVYALYKESTDSASVVYQTNNLGTQLLWDDSNVRAITSILTNGLGGLTQLDLAANGYAQANGEYTGSTTLTNQTNGIQLINNFSFGKPKATTGVGASQNFLSVTQNTDNGTGDAAQLYLNSALSSFASGNAAGGYFTLLDAQGDVQWTGSAVATVPLPAAAFLFVPGLLAMAGIGRRRNAKAA
jgi:hypothetical protein